MFRRFVLFLFSLCICFLGIAQTHEFKLSYSPLSIYALDNIIEDDSYKVQGMVSADYSFYLKEWMKAGLSVAYDRAVSNEQQIFSYYIDGYPHINYEGLVRQTKQVLVLAPQVEFEFVRKERFRLGCGIGVGWFSERYVRKDRQEVKKLDAGWMVQVSLLNFRWGQKWGVCGDLGVGYKGVLNLGCFYRF